MLPPRFVSRAFGYASSEGKARLISVGGDGQVILWDVEGNILSSDNSNAQEAESARDKQALADVAINADATMCCCAAP